MASGSVGQVAHALRELIKLHGRWKSDCVGSYIKVTTKNHLILSAVANCVGLVMLMCCSCYVDKVAQLKFRACIFALQM